MLTSNAICAFCRYWCEGLLQFTFLSFLRFSIGDNFGASWQSFREHENTRMADASTIKMRILWISLITYTVSKYPLKIFVRLTPSVIKRTIFRSFFSLVRFWRFCTASTRLMSTRHWLNGTLPVDFFSCWRCCWYYVAITSVNLEKPRM